jgi:hypothetical protein
MERLSTWVTICLDALGVRFFKHRSITHLALKEDEKQEERISASSFGTVDKSREDKQVVERWPNAFHNRDYGVLPIDLIGTLLKPLTSPKSRYANHKY